MINFNNDMDVMSYHTHQEGAEPIHQDSSLYSEKKEKKNSKEPARS